MPVAGIVTAAIVILVAADRVPAFNVEPFCRAVAIRAAPIGDKDICLWQEQEAREQLVGSRKANNNEGDVCDDDDLGTEWTGNMDCDDGAKNKGRQQQH
jgi:hypothetical protein